MSNRVKNFLLTDNLEDILFYAEYNSSSLFQHIKENLIEHELILCRKYLTHSDILTKGKPKCFNPIKIPCKCAGRNNPSGTFRMNGEDGKTGKAHTQKTVSSDKIKYNIWFYNVGFNNTTKDKMAFKHPAIFPEKLAEDHILSWSNEGDTVLDCFMGSATTGKMALLNNRKFIGIEKVEDYFEISKQRIEESLNEVS